MKRRLIPLFLAISMAILSLALTLWAMPTPANQIAHAELPPGHPVINQPGSPIQVTARVSTTVHDFFLPGSQPNQMVDELWSPLNCTYCHGEGYSSVSGQEPETETWYAWSGSMMSQAGRDPLFYAALDVANADAANAGEFCLRCHLPRGWLEGRSSAPDGSAMTFDDLEGVQCIICHRLVDPVYTAENPLRDLQVLAALSSTVTITGSASMIVDPEDYRRGPLVITDAVGFDPHTGIGGAQDTLTSPYHRQAAMCGTCHDIVNPVFSWNPVSQQYEPNPLDTPGDPATAFPVERTYSEWFLSDYNTPEGVYAPALGGNRPYVSICQDCHMRAVDGVGGLYYGNPAPSRSTLAFHDLTGGNTWVPQTIPLHPTFGAVFTGTSFARVRAQALISGTLRARYMLQQAATLSVTWQGDQLQVTVVNQTGHKLPTGYPEGRRMWLQVMGYDVAGNLVYVSGAYDGATAVLTPDPDLKLYEVQPGLTPDLATALGLPAGQSFHFALNNVIVSDNRIPPRGYEFAAFAAAGAAPMRHSQPDPTLYADGQYWDTTVYTLPAGVVRGEVRLLYQTTSKEYVEFLRDNNPYPGHNNGQILYDLWLQTNKNAPEVMAELSFGWETYLPVLIRP